MTNTIAEVISSLFPGLKFDPNDVQLLLHYLKPKNREQLPRPDYLNMIPDVDVLKLEPWELHSQFSHMFSSEKVFFFSRLETKYLSSSRYNRTTKVGFWKQTSKGHPIERDGEEIGEKRTLVFYKGRMANPKRPSERTGWVMHEYHLNPKCLGDDRDENEELPYVVCWIKNNKNGKLMMDPAPTSVNQQVAAAHPEMESLLQSRPPDAMSSDYTTLVHQPQARAEHGSPSLPVFSRGDDGTGLDFLLSSPSDGDDPLLPNICENCLEEYYFHCDCIERQS